MEYNFDRECPNCGKMSLVELGKTKWKCMNPDCNEIFDEEFLDYSEE